MTEQLQEAIKPKCQEVLACLLRTRLTDDKMGKLVRQNKGGTFHLSTAGHEMIGAVAAANLESEKDWALPYYRDRAVAVGMGCALDDLFASFLTRVNPHHSSAKQMPEHFSHKRLRIPTQSSVVGSQFLHAVGIALGAKLSNSNELAYVSGGDGSTSQGDFHEALNFATIHQLGVIFVIQDNGWAISTPVKDQLSGGSIAKRSAGYEGLSVFEVNGTSFEELDAAFKEAVAKGRAMGGPSLIVAKDIPRIAPHSISDDHNKYKDAEDFALDQMRDPIPLFETFLTEQGIMSAEEIAALHATYKDEVEAAAKQAESLPFPDLEQATEPVYLADDLGGAQPTKGVVSETPVVIVDALNHALAEEMERDEKVVVFGQDVAFGKGGVFGVTRTLTDQFGQKRCFNSPLAESTIVGLAIGLAFAGYRPVVEIQFCDYMWTGINQIFNELSSVVYRSNGEYHCPVVIRMPCGGYIQGGPYHSQSVEAFLAHCPGLKIALPSQADDAKRLLKAAIRDPNPVIFLEHKALYRQRLFSARPEPAADEILPLGHANVVHEGDDLTVVTYGMLTPMAYEVAREMAKEGITAEVIDLRTVSPLDMETVLKSVKKTGKVLVAHEAALTCGFGAEIAARIADEAFVYLDAPVKRMGAADCPVPYAKVLEDVVLPQKEGLEREMRALAAF